MEITTSDYIRSALIVARYFSVFLPLYIEFHMHSRFSVFLASTPTLFNAVAFMADNGTFLAIALYHNDRIAS
jgi:hypothetical protein